MSVQITLSLNLEIPADSLLALKLTPEQARSELPLMAAIKLYELGRLSTGAAAQLAGIPKPLFLTKLADYGVDTFTLTVDEFNRETRLE